MNCCPTLPTAGASAVMGAGNSAVMGAATEYLPATGRPPQDLVLLHGWGGNRELWRPLLAQLRQWANVTLLDIPGLSALLE